MSTDEEERSTETRPLPGSTRDESMIEGEEAPPPGVAVMAIVRWAILGAVAFLAIVTWWSYARAQMHGHDKAVRAAAQYHCPMHPQIVSDEPGECPICHMSLEPMGRGRTTPAPAQPTATLATMPPGTAPITLSFDRIQAIGVRTAVVGGESRRQTLRVTATVAPTEQGAAEVHVRSPGFVETMRANQTGVAVGRRQVLFSYYSPEIFQAESELLATHQWASEGEGKPSPSDAARSKLELLGMSAPDIGEVLRTKKAMRSIPIYAPQGGYVAQKNLVVGSYITPEMVLYEIQDLAHVYVVADVFQQDIAYVQKGTTGRFFPARGSDRPIDVRVDLVYPSLNAEARTTRVRMQIENPKGTTFRPGDYGTVELTTPARSVLEVPRDALVDTGLSTYVFVVQGEGSFVPHEVTVGQEQGEMVAILAGVAAGDRVVSGATFLIDSESRLQASAVQASASTPQEPAMQGSAPSRSRGADR